MGFKQEHLLKKIALVYFLSKMIGSADQFWLSDPGATPEMIKKHVFQFKENETTNYFTFSSKIDILNELWWKNF